MQSSPFRIAGFRATADDLALLFASGTPHPWHDVYQNGSPSRHTLPGAPRISSTRSSIEVIRLNPVIKFKKAFPTLEVPKFFMLSESCSPFPNWLAAIPARQNIIDETGSPKVTEYASSRDSSLVLFAAIAIRAMKGAALFVSSPTTSLRTTINPACSGVRAGLSFDFFRFDHTLKKRARLYNRSPLPTRLLAGKKCRSFHVVVRIISVPLVL